MKKTVLINPTGLKGSEINERMKELMGIKPITENKSSIVVELTKKGPDGNSYAVIRENHEWYIKKTTKTSNLVAEDFQYIGGLKNKKSEAYPSYAQAIKHLNLKFRSLAEAYNYDGEINLFINDNLLSESGFAGFSSEGSGFSRYGNMEGYEPMEEGWMEESMYEEDYMGEVEMTEAELAIDEMMNRQDEAEFPDLTGDGKVTRADILKGRGVDLDEAFKTQDELNQFAGHEDYQWYIVNPKGEIVDGYEYLLDAFDSFIEYSTQGEEANHLFVEASEGVESLHEMAENFLSSYGYGEPGDDLDDYDQGELDEFISYVSTKIPFARYDYGEGEELGDQFINGFRIVKKDDGMYESKKAESIEETIKRLRNKKTIEEARINKITDLVIDSITEGLKKKV
jgi:hypothetical protein